MARKNIVNLTGIVATEPKFGERAGVPFAFFRLTAGRVGHSGTDEPIIEAFGDAMDAVKGLQFGDSVYIEGELRTREAQKRIVCSRCNTTHFIDLMVTTVVAQTVVPSEGKRFSQNHVYLLGVLVKDPFKWTTNQGVAKTKYQVAVNRKDSIGGTDYPFITSYGPLALRDRARLVQGSQLFVDGSIQTAKRQRQVNCPNCGAIHTFTSINTEILVRGTEYLNRCVALPTEDPNEFQYGTYQSKNIANLTGIIGSEPKYAERHGERFAFFRLIANRLGYVGTDEPIVEMFGDALDSIDGLKLGDSVHVEGEIRTREAQKRIECGQCHAGHLVDLFLTTVATQVPIRKIEGAAFPQNHVYFLGVLATPPSKWTTSQGVAKSKYQMEISRQNSRIGVDNPFVVSYGRLANEDNRRLVEGSQLLIDGAVQTIRRERQVVCPHCGANGVFSAMQVQVVARSTEYLNRCVFPENNDPNHYEEQALQRIANAVTGKSAVVNGGLLYGSE